MDLSKFATSKNLTILGVLMIVQAILQAVIAAIDGKPETVVDLNVTFTQISLGVAMIMAKGQSNTGGTVPVTPEAAARVTQNPTP